MQAFEGAGPQVRNVQLYLQLIFLPNKRPFGSWTSNQELDFSYNINNYFVIKEKIREGDSRWTHLTGSREEGTVFQVVEKLLKDNLYVKI